MNILLTSSFKESFSWIFRSVLGTAFVTFSAWNFLTAQEAESDSKPVITVTPITATESAPSETEQAETFQEAEITETVPRVEPDPQLERYEFQDEKMAVPVRLIFYAESKDRASVIHEAIARRFDELNEIMSDYNPESELVRACRQSGESSQPVEISRELYSVLSMARRIDRLTQGAFDVSVSPIVKLWRRSRLLGTRPPERYLTEAKQLVGRNNWELLNYGIGGRISKGVIGRRPEHYALRVLKKNVRLDLGGIAKGFAIDEGFRILHESGIRSAMIDAGGDIRVGDAPPGKNGWTIGVASLAANGNAAFYMAVENAAIATSGDSFQFVEIDGVRYSHLIDPRNGEPLTRHSVVSVLAPTATEADALASAVSVLGPSEGISLIESLDGIETMIFLENGKTPEIFATGRFIPIKDDLLSGKTAE